MNLEIEYKTNNTYPKFEQKMRNKTIALVFDKNTKPFALKIKESLLSINFIDVFFNTNDYIPTLENCSFAEKIAKNCDYILAIGSGSINDTVKYVATKIGIECGVLPTAASMDGYVSKGAALMEGDVKVTETVNTPTYILIDLEIIANAPKDMTASGFGDIIGKFTCMTDWKLSHLINNEEINEEAYSLMEKARTDCVNLYEGLTQYKFEAIAKLIEALIVAGLSMATCGNSRPASGSEHHMSHFLEMDFVKRKERIPLHGVKVAIGTLISIELYNCLLKLPCEVPYLEGIKLLINDLPKVDEVKSMLIGMGCPTRFSEIGVRKETMEEMLDKAYTVRDRYTILTYYHDNDFMKYVKEYIMSKYY